MSDNSQQGDTLNEFKLRAVKGVISRHERRIRAEAESIRETAGYLLAALDKGQHRGDRAREILASAQEIVARFSALEAITETTEILSVDGES